MPYNLIPVFQLRSMLKPMIMMKSILFFLKKKLSNSRLECKNHNCERFFSRLSFFKTVPLDKKSNYGICAERCRTPLNIPRFLQYTEAHNAQKQLFTQQKTFIQKFLRIRITNPNRIVSIFLKNKLFLIININYQVYW